MAEREYPRTTFYPSGKVVLIPRFDEFGAKPPPAPTKRAPVRRGKGKDKDLALQVKQVNGVFVLAGPNDDPTHLGGPQEQKGKNDFEVVLIPRTCSLGLNGPRAAASLRAEFQYRDLPIDPRTLRSAAVEFYLGTVSAEDFHAGIGGATRTVGDPGSSSTIEPLHLVPSMWTDSHGKQRSNLRFQGFVDDWEVEWGSDEPIISISCTDNTRLLIDQFAPPQLTVDPKIPIQEAIARYLASFPQFRGLGVRFIGSNPPKLGEALAKTAFQPKLGPAPSKGGDSKMNVWDYLTDVTGAVGLLIRMEGTNVVVQRPRQLFKGSRKEQREDDPWRARRLPTGRVLARRTFVYGRNLENLRVKRNFTKFAPTNIEVRCYDGKRKKTLVARFPEKKDRQTDVKPGDNSEQKWLVIRITGVDDDKTLKVVAQSAYESIGRNELLVNFTTRNPCSFGGDNNDPDVLDLKVGDSIDIEASRDEEAFIVSSVNALEETLVIENRARQFMAMLGFSDAFAAAYAKAFVNVGLQSIFKVRKLSLEWSLDDGITAQVEAVNYVVVRADKVLTEKAEPEPEDQDQPDEIVDVRVED